MPNIRVCTHRYTHVNVKRGRNAKGLVFEQTCIYMSYRFKLQTCKYVGVYIHVDVCMYVCIYIHERVYKYVCMYVCMYT